MTKSTRRPTKPRTAKPARKAQSPRAKQAPRKEAARASVAARSGPATHLGVPVDTATAPEARLSRPSKKATIIALLQRREGATLPDLMAATGWLEHSVRAALTGLRRDGQEVLRRKNAADVTTYRIVPAHRDE